MKMIELDSEGHLPTYTRKEITDALHAFGFRTDLKIVTQKEMKSEIVRSYNYRKIAVNVEIATFVAIFGVKDEISIHF